MIYLPMLLKSTDIEMGRSHMKANTTAHALDKIVYGLEGEVSKLLGCYPKRVIVGLGIKRGWLSNRRTSWVNVAILLVPFFALRIGE
jgi:hypothetical protein